MFLSLVRPDRISSPMMSSAAVTEASGMRRILLRAFSAWDADAQASLRLKNVPIPCYGTPLSLDLTDALLRTSHRRPPGGALQALPCGRGPCDRRAGDGPLRQSRRHDGPEGTRQPGAPFPIRQPEAQAR